MNTKRLVVSSGEYKGRYIGPNIAGLVTNPELRANPQVPIPGATYSMYVQQQPATQFFEANVPRIQAELKNFGIETEIVD
jgi:hypothetical protein